MSPEPTALILPQGTSVAHLFDEFTVFLISSGAAEVMGGVEVLREGIEELKAGALVLGSELHLVDQQRVSLSAAVYDTERFPHLTRLHGYFENLLTAEIPAELVPWVCRIVSTTQPREAASIRHTIVTTAVRDTNPIYRALARLAIFESICLRQRIELLRTKFHLPAIGGSRRDIEALAQRELEALEDGPEYRDALLRMDDPLGTLQKAGLGGLNLWVETLKRELRGVHREVIENLEWRQTLLTLGELLEPRDRAIFMNDAAKQFDEQRLAPEQLLQLNPIHLAGLGEAGVRQRRARMKAKARALLASVEDLESMEPPKRASTLGDVLLEASNEAEVS